VVLSAKTASALSTMTQHLATYAQAHPDAHLADIAYTLQMGRKSFPHRQAFVARDRTHMLHVLETIDPESVFTDIVSGETKQVAFLFPGQGTQYVNMGRELYEQEPTFRDQMDTCAKLLIPHLQMDLRKVIYPAIEQESGSLDGNEAPSLSQTDMAQPALFVIEYALAQLLMKWGIHPQVLIGHSIGEYVAACLAGVFDLPDALALVALRGRLMQALPPGAMLSITLPEKDVEEFLGESLALAACNGPNESVVSGPTEAIELLEKHLREKGISSQRLRTSHAFHSQMMEPTLELFRADISKRALRPPRIPYISNITGTWITDQEATNPDYWAQHIRQTVRFTAGIQLLLNSPNTVLLEVGPGHSLSTLARRAMPVGTTAPVCPPTDQFILSSLRHPQTQISDRAFLLNTCGRLWCAGVAIDWSQFSLGSQPRRIPLPTYPFERQRHWISARTGTGLAPTRVPTESKQDLARWFSVPSWKRSPLPAILPEQSEQKACWLIFTDPVGLGTHLVSHLREQGEATLTVHAGTQFGKINDGEYSIRPACAKDYDTLLNDMSSRGLSPTHIVHMWTVIATDHIQSGLDYLETAQALGFYSLLFLIQALGEQKDAQPQEIAVISNNLQEVMGGEVLCPVRATALGVGKVASREYSRITFRSIDIVLPMTIKQAQTVPTSWDQLVDQMTAELRWRSSDVTVAYRGLHRWVQCIEPVQLPPVPEEKLPLRAHGVYLITGGFGGIGMTLAEYLARQVKARLVLIGRTALPAREEWDRRLATANGHDVTPELASEASKIRQVKRLEELGAEVLVLEADVTDLEQMQAVIQQVQRRFGDLHGIIHSAGSPGGGLIQLKTPEVAAEVLAPKVRGTLVLEAVLKDLQPDFIVLCSSLTALIGELGQVDYCAANTFLDTFAFYHRVQQRAQTISINWGAWQEVGMAANTQKTYKNAHKYNAGVEQGLQHGIFPQEGVESFRRILINRAIPQVIVSTSDIQTRLQQAKSFHLSALQDEDDGLVPPSATASVAHQRPNLQTSYVAPQNETQQQIVDLWQKLLGIEKIGIHDNFIELGGHSLLGTQMITRLRDMFQVDLKLRTLFEDPTVARLALVIVQRKAELVDNELLLQAIEDVEHLADDEVQKLLALDMKQIGRTQKI
jgi:acyl transferase domain-containing protein